MPEWFLCFLVVNGLVPPERFKALSFHDLGHFCELLWSQWEDGNVDLRAVPPVLLSFFSPLVKDPSLCVYLPLKGVSDALMDGSSHA